MDSGNLEEDYKRGMRGLASTVAILTTVDPGGEWFGMSATAVCSVSTRPPSLVACVARSASLFQPLSAGSLLCVNLLRTTHRNLVAAFAGKLKGRDRFALGDWQTDAHGPPNLADAQAVFFCRVQKSLSHGDHGVVVADVDDVRTSEQIEPLVFQDGRLAETRLLD